LRPLLPDAGAVIAIVGGGGKTSALFTLADELATGRKADVIVTTTTHIVDPRTEACRPIDQVFLSPALAGPPLPGTDRPWDRVPRVDGRGRRVVLAAGDGSGRLLGLHPAWIGSLRATWPLIVIEADGSRHRPVKAPAPHEPVLPPCADLILGVIGLDCLGRPMDEGVVHRPERFGPVTGCAPGAPIRLEHLAALCRAPEGLFKGAPAGARRVLLLNKADLCGLAPEALIRGLRAGPDPALDLILVAALGNSDPGARVLVQA
jgi:probable selenium-dependent hydroxylase accessory protein YqeC